VDIGSYMETITFRLWIKDMFLWNSHKPSMDSKY